VFVALVAIGISSAPCVSQSPCEQRVAGGELVFRAPFELRLQVDSQRSCEEKFDHVPFVAGDAVYLFAGEAFGVNVTISGNRLCRVTYQPDPAKADVDFRFTQEKSPAGSMMLVIHNHLNWKLRLRAQEGQLQPHQRESPSHCGGLRRLWVRCQNLRVIPAQALRSTARAYALSKYLAIHRRSKGEQSRAMHAHEKGRRVLAFLPIKGGALTWFAPVWRLLRHVAMVDSVMP